MTRDLAAQPRREIAMKLPKQVAPVQRRAISARFPARSRCRTAPGTRRSDAPQRSPPAPQPVRSAPRTACRASPRSVRRAASTASDRNPIGATSRRRDGFPIGSRSQLATDGSVASRPLRRCNVRSHPGRAEKGRLVMRLPVQARPVARSTSSAGLRIERHAVGPLRDRLQRPAGAAAFDL